MVPPSEQVRMLDGLKASFAGKAAKQRDLKPDPQQHGIAVRACLAALTGLQAIADLYKGIHNPCTADVTAGIRLFCHFVSSNRLNVSRYYLYFWSDNQSQAVCQYFVLTC